MKQVKMAASAWDKAVIWSVVAAGCIVVIVSALVGGLIWVGLLIVAPVIGRHGLPPVCRKSNGIETSRLRRGNSVPTPAAWRPGGLNI